MKRYSIILGMPKHNNIFAEIIKNLKFHNFDVVFIESSQENIKGFKYKNFIDRLINAVRKIIFRDFTYKKKLKEKYIIDRAKKLLTHDKYDYAVIIRPDMYSENLLGFIRNHTKNRMVGYQWDGLKRFPEINSKIKIFDDFFVFDSNDLQDKDFKQYRLKGITNFYFDVNKPMCIHNGVTTAYFVGSHFESRVSTLDKCAKALAELNVHIKFIIPTDDFENILKYRNHDLMTYGTRNKVSFAENLSNVNEADILIDIINPVHQGLSFRVFEALYYRKKLITNNSIIQSFDFFHPNNILVWEDNQDMDKLLADFLEKPLKEIDPQIFKKYSFGNWINYVLELNPHQKIELP